MRETGRRVTIQRPRDSIVSRASGADFPAWVAGLDEQTACDVDGGESGERGREHRVHLGRAA